MRKLLIGAAVAAVAVVAAPNVANAFNPAEYTGNGKPQFNVYTDVEGFGNEKDFVRVGGKNTPSGQRYTNTYEACDGDATITMYVHNGAPEGFNGTNNDGTGVAHDTRVKISVPATSAGNISGSISAKDRDGVAVPGVTDTAKITCNGEEVAYELDTSSVQLFSIDRGTVSLNTAQGAAIASGAGLQIGSVAGDGLVPGCWNYRVYVKMTVKIKKIVKTPKYTCDRLEALPVNNKKNTYTFRAKASAENAAIKSYVIDFGNGETQTIESNATEVTSREVAYNKDANAKLTVNFTVGNETKTATDPTKCVVAIKVNQPPVNPPVPQVPTTIVETGAGSTVAIFSAVTALAYGIKRWFDSRRGLAKA